jgi:hypothetical protein
MDETKGRSPEDRARLLVNTYRPDPFEMAISEQIQEAVQEARAVEYQKLRDEFAPIRNEYEGLKRDNAQMKERLAALKAVVRGLEEVAQPMLDTVAAMESMNWAGDTFQLINSIPWTYTNLKSLRARVKAIIKEATL